jgi:hypothetical protein
MGIPVLIMGRSGTGKSTSMRNFAKDEIGVINVSRKPLPFRGGFDAMAETDDYDTVFKILGRASKKSIVIDDAGYLIVNMFMRGHAAAGSGNAIFGFYNSVGDTFWRLVEYVKSMPRDRIVYVIMHEDASDAGDVKPKTIGKILDEKVCLEGMFTIVLRAVNEGGRFVFRTQSDGHDVSKSPIGMFQTVEIDNDLTIVDKAIREYWDLTDKKVDEKEQK